MAAVNLRKLVRVDIVAALALIGAIAVGEYLAAGLIIVMFATGRFIEGRASARASRDLRLLLARTPQAVHRYDGGQLVDVAISAARAGDLLLVRPGEVVPVDGLVDVGIAVLDESALTGEAIPVERPAGDTVRSGVVNAGGPFDLRATTSADESTYAGIIRLVQSAAADSAPFVRLADRYAAWFLPLALAVAAAAGIAAGDLKRAVAVLVVATPCPLILAAPVAIVSGLARSTRRGVIIKGGAALEALAQGQVLLFDKTGTVTGGRPTIAEVLTAGPVPAVEILRLAACVDQISPHVLAGSVVRAARQRGLVLELPVDAEEVTGHGVRGLVGGRLIAVGKASWLCDDPVNPFLRTVRRRADLDGFITVFVSVDGVLAGALLLDDPVRPDAARTIRRLRHAGIERMVMVTGDRMDVAEAVGAAIGVDQVLAERTPGDKVDAVRLERRLGRTIMVGDGINDAPALALADVGVAMGAAGSSAASESADVVLTVNRFERLAEALVIARRTRRIALQSVMVGMGLSLVAMGFATFGLLPPAAGAILQEVIDVAVILNSLRAAGHSEETIRIEGDDAVVSRRFSAEHQYLRPELDRLRAAADQLSEESLASLWPELLALQVFLVDDLLPHEEAEDSELYPMLSKVLGGNDPTGTMSRAHVEIAHLVRRVGRLIADIVPERADYDDVRELRRVLYGLHAVLKLHFAQEDEGFLTLVDEDAHELGGPQNARRGQ